ncbi:hypothetical protein [Clostridium botulinum]|uniref:hypothetical protein n=1 Tax=Clostridium botulinum TaxID=1491 RepID=UPI000774941F|nr:hypothetical protein [Clostridium botulinum]MBY6930997.1 hypothetical protein [Clostridium botulinum]NFG21378.1 hypothetical protein [Clostridium botulinum]NFO82141.1 hypothetical protein [Clostridium botulinum]
MDKSESKELVEEMIEKEIILTDKPTVVEAVIRGSYYKGKEDADSDIRKINMKATIDLLNVAEDYLRAINNRKCIEVRGIIKSLESEL